VNIAYTNVIANQTNQNYTGTIVPITISVLLPSLTESCNSEIIVPINVSDLSGLNITAYEFDVHYDNTILTGTNELILEGTLTPSSGWFTVANNTPGVLSIAAAGTSVLSGSGNLIKLKFNSLSVESTSPLTFANFTFNSGTPQANTTDGNVTVSCQVCGDADENGLIQAFDASLVLQDVVNLIQLPPQGVLNGDVDMNGNLQAFDASLILQEVVGLTLPVPSCFDVSQLPKESSKINYSTIEFNVKPQSIIQNDINFMAELSLSGFTSEDNISAIQFELDMIGVDGTLNINTLEDGYIIASNRIHKGKYRIAIINAGGINASDINLKLNSNSGIGIDDININDIYLNDYRYKDISINKLSGLLLSDYSLVGAFPNPFNPSTKIVFQMPVRDVVIIEIFDLLGNSVMSLMNEEKESGRYEVIWNGMSDHGQKVSSGIYFVAMRTSSYNKAIKINLLK
jgi:hypothetical protein